MADRETEVVAKIAGGIAGLNAAAWDRLAGADPFVSYAFLGALEESGSVGPGTGWTPAPILIEDDGGHLLACAPAYLKAHSQGEYVFDHGWADAWQRAGGDYYPKLQVAVPFTPVPGSRLLGARPQQLLAAMEAVTVQNGMSSAHVTFIDEAGTAECERRGWLIRHGLQYHWFNRGYGNFDGFLATLRSAKRKTVRKERDAACRGVDVRTLRGAEIGPDEWDAMWAFYQDTGSRKWGRPYLTRHSSTSWVRAWATAWCSFLRTGTASRSPAHSTSLAVMRSMAATGAQARTPRSSTSSSAIIARSSGPSNTG
jgi:predicted N-acyltransferase